MCTKVDEFHPRVGQNLLHACVGRKEILIFWEKKEISLVCLIQHVKEERNKVKFLQAPS